MKDNRNSKNIKSKKKLNKNNFTSTNYFNKSYDKLMNYEYGYLNNTKTNSNIVKSVLNQTVHPEDSTMSRTKITDSVVSTRIKEMKEILDRFEKNEANLSKEKYLGNLYKILNDFLTEIIELNPHFGFILNKLKVEFEAIISNVNKLKAEIERIKNDNNELSKSITEVIGKLEVSEALNKLLKKNNNELKNEIDEVRSNLFETKNKLTEIIEDGLSKKVAEELEGMFKENQYFRQIIGSLKFDLNKSRIRENILITTMKGKNLFTNSVEARLEEAKLGEIEVGKNHIKIPKLNFSMLEYSDSDDDSYSYISNEVGQIQSAQEYKSFNGNNLNIDI